MAKPMICPGHGWPVPEEEVYQLPVYFTPTQLARHLGVSRQAVCKWIMREGLLAYRKENDAYTIIRSEFIEWAQNTGRFKPNAQQRAAILC
ncbi:MAG: helix-turn-helix domain-containing protein [Planctomycetota bacterium]